MIVVLAIDGLEITLVEQFGCRALMQEYHGRTDISEFSEPRTIVLWSSFLAGRNTEKEVLALGKEEMWGFALKKEETFLAGFEAPCVIDLPAYCYDQRQHGEERRLLREYFTADADKRGEILRRYNDLAFAHHRKIKAEFEEALKQNHDIVIGYFSLADVVGHLNFGNRTMMRLVYKEFDEIAQKVRSVPCLCSQTMG